ncbi:RHS repeat-associated core domain-containing protein [Rubellicoccus peritrichatus]|uniref:RHS repeat-associated core domain-containing protein n=1 Tax=Rubellicoccus peritrichatus TaxID=3080537 RepID=A0AAQ3LHX4_9BACT|nr:RHS repeat-associated core domain-containing protein [Puniceicoccus sp. CR14]WOO42394.1 RHS repeat-associated core domain-containing protein [Puniceicoccus sp. CR14]
MNLRKTLYTTVGGICTALTLQGLTIEENYEYDALGRLSAVKVTDRPDLSQTYSYDASGNLIEKTVGGQSTRMSYDKANQLVNRMDPSGITEFDYDGAGRLIRERMGDTTIAEYQYGYLDKVISVNRNGHKARFHYSPSGMLVAKETKGGMEKWAWDGLALVARGNERYINEPHISGGVPIVAFDASGNKVNYMENDYLGNTLASYSRDGANASYTAGNVTPFGESLDVELRSGLDQPRFTGKPYDNDLGAYVFPYRNYRTDVNRWMTYDPSGFPDGSNQHYYAPVPTSGLDPLGLWTEVGNLTVPYQGADYEVKAMSGGQITSMPQAHQNLIQSYNLQLSTSFSNVAQINTSNFSPSTETGENGVPLGGVVINSSATTSILNGNLRWVQIRDSNVGTNDSPAGLVLDGPSNNAPYYSRANEQPSNTLSDRPSRFVTSATKDNPVTWKAWSYLFSVDSAGVGHFLNIGGHWGFEIHEL